MAKHGWPYTGVLYHLAASVLLIALAVLSSAAQREHTIAEIQGNGNTSPVVGRHVKITGIVTALHRTGFFVQTPEENADNDPLTSEGIFVFTRSAPPITAAIGNLVSLTGTVEEYRPRNEQNTLSLTELAMQTGRDSIRVVSRGNPLPKPATITPADLAHNRIDQLERFEGMRVHVDRLTAVSPTSGRVDIKTASAISNGTFYAVLKGTPRPFREPGLDPFEFEFLSDREKADLRKNFSALPFFDGNPERLRIESLGQPESRPINVFATAEIADLTGVLHYAFRNYTILVDAASRHSASGSIRPIAMPTPNERQVTFASSNLENFFDDVDDPDIREDVVTREGFAARLKKISMAIRLVLQMPDVIGISEAENLNALKRLAERINSDAVAARLPNPRYEAYLIEGNDGRGIDNGFLVKTSRVTVREVRQFGKADTYKHPRTGEPVFLNDRPPLVLRAHVDDPKVGRPFAFTVITNHLKSFSGYSDPEQKENVRLKKRLQAEFLARLIQQRQRDHPDEHLIVMGDFNSYQFSDGVLDLMGTITGRPSPVGSVLDPSPDLVEPDLTNLVEAIAAGQRYSYVFDGNAQVLDHILIGRSLMNHINGFGYARLNADFPDVLRNDPNRPERFSDHDPAVTYFSIEPVKASQ